MFGQHLSADAAGPGDRVAAGGGHGQRQQVGVDEHGERRIDWPENVVFTTEEIVKKYPEAVQAFVTGRYQGYRYALANRQEAVQILIKYNSNLKGSEAHELEGMDAIAAIMITDSSKKNGLGYVDPAGWERVAKDMARAKLFAAVPNYRAAFTTKFPSKVMP